MDEGTQPDPISELKTEAANLRAPADAYADHRRWGDAIETLNAALTLDPDDADLHLRLGAVYDEAGSSDLAEAAYRTAIALQPNHGTTYLRLGSLLERLSHYPDAIDTYKACLSVSADPPESAEARSRLQRILREHPGADTSAEAPAPEVSRAEMLKEVRSWGYWSLGLGVVHLLVSGLSGTWGVVLLLVGLASFIFHEPSMFVVYAITLAWVALSNMMSGQIGWIAFAAVQLFLAFRVFRKHAHFQKAEAALEDVGAPQRAGRSFPQIGCALGSLALVGWVAVLAAVFLMGITGTTEVPTWVSWLESLMTSLGILGLSVGVAALVSGYRFRAISLLGAIAGALVVLGGIVIAVVL